MRAGDPPLLLEIIDAVIRAERANLEKDIEAYACRIIKTLIDVNVTSVSEAPCPCASRAGLTIMTTDTAAGGDRRGVHIPSTAAVPTRRARVPRQHPSLGRSARRARSLRHVAARSCCLMRSQVAQLARLDALLNGNGGILSNTALINCIIRTLTSRAGWPAGAVVLRNLTLRGALGALANVSLRVDELALSGLDTLEAASVLHLPAAQPQTLSNWLAWDELALAVAGSLQVAPLDTVGGCVLVYSHKVDARSCAPGSDGLGPAGNGRAESVAEQPAGRAGPADGGGRGAARRTPGGADARAQRHCVLPVDHGRAQRHRAQR